MRANFTDRLPGETGRWVRMVPHPANRRSDQRSISKIVAYLLAESAVSNLESHG